MKRFFLILGFLLIPGICSAAVLHLTWADNSSDETDFRIERGADPGGSFAEIVQTAANVTSYTDTNLTAGQQYCYRIRACNSGTCSGYTSPICQRALGLPVGDEFR